MNNAHFQKARGRIRALAATTVLACTVSSAAFAQSCYDNTNPNLIKNGGFETGSDFNITDWKVKWSGTLSTGQPVDPYVTIGTDHPYDGKQELDIGTTDGANDIYQPVKGATAGATYTVCFWLESDPDPAVGKTSFSVLWNDITELELMQSGPSQYQYYSFTVTAASSAAGGNHLRFRERNDDGYYYLDDVAVQLCSSCTSRAQVKNK